MYYQISLIKKIFSYIHFSKLMFTYNCIYKVAPTKKYQFKESFTFFYYKNYDIG